jgi:hypothetical protein
MKREMPSFFSCYRSPGQILDDDDQEELLNKDLPHFKRKEAKGSILVITFSMTCLFISGALRLWQPHYVDLDKVCSVYTSQYSEFKGQSIALAFEF